MRQFRAVIFDWRGTLVTTLLLPPLTDVRRERLGLAAWLLGVLLGVVPPSPGHRDALT
ncbi:hypothetical protein ABTW72_27395 [Micromonospora sp. NPDC127501]|uniref:hypothetical protein n=1 Tax=Micromonospora sp. NPDC127501 TaxID=3154872 RepID=UPI00332D93C0